MMSQLNRNPIMSPHPKLKVMKELIDDMLTADVIEPSSSA